MLNNKGWIRIVESSIAVLIIFSVLIVVSRNEFNRESPQITSLLTPILEEIARNITLRQEIVENGEEAIPALEYFIQKRIKQSTIKFEVVVCNVDEICSLDAYPQEVGEVYAAERVISATLQNYNPRKIKIFAWRLE